MANFDKKALYLHKKNRGKIEIRSKVPLNSRHDLSLAYTPGVAAVSRAIAADSEKSWELTNRANSVAIISDGTAVLGLGDIGPLAAMPVMEGKAAIFKKYANIDAYPLCIQASGVEELVRFCRAVAPSFGGLNLEDIKAPICFDLLEQLERSCQIPVFHDDQDGTAIVTLAALINACRVTGKVMPELKVVVNGSGAAGIAITKLLLYQGVRQVVLLDSQGAIYKGRPAMNSYKQAIAAKTNSAKLKGGLTEVLPGMDVFVGVSKGGVLTANMVKSMAEDPIILAMANPDPEIEPKAAKQAGAAVVGTGRSDYPNQINNALVFPGVFRGLLDGRINLISAKVKTAAALALAYTIHPNANRILPNVSNKKIVPAIARAIKAKQS